MSKTDYSQSTVGGFSPPIPLISIIGDNRGYVSVNFGSGTNTGFILFGPNGQSEEDGGGGERTWEVHSITGNGTT